MEYGIFSEAAVNWFFLKIAIGLAVLGVVTTLIAVYSDRSHKENYEKKHSLWGYGIKEHSNVAPIITGFVAALSFIGAIVLLIFGLLEGHTGDCLNQKYAGEGSYRVVQATLVYEINKSTGRPQKPERFQLQLEGRTDSTSPSDWKIPRCVNISYNQMAENYAYLSDDLPDLEENSTAKKYEVRKEGFEAKYKAHVPVSTPEFAVKRGNWWKFSDEMR